MKGFLPDDKPDGHTSRGRFRLHLYVFEVAGAVQDLDLLAERVGRKTIVGLERETPLDRLEFNALLPANGDRRDRRHAVLGVQRRPYTERVEAPPARE
jgi:hypothetical protein